MVIDDNTLPDIETLTITGDTLIRENTLIRLYAKLGLHISRSLLSQYRRRGEGPPCIRFNRAVFYRLGDARSWMETYLGCSVRRAVELGRLEVPAEMLPLQWDCDDMPVAPKQVAAE